MLKTIVLFLQGIMARVHRYVNLTLKTLIIMIPRIFVQKELNILSGWQVC